MSQLFVQIATPGSGAEVPRNFEVTGSISVQFTHTQAHLTRSSVNVQFGDNGPVVAATFLTPTTWRCIGQLDPSLAPGTPVNIKVTANGLIQFPIGPGEPGSEDVQATATLAVRVVSPLCPSNLPLVLLPVRLETRFFSLPNSVTELRVRIYPDKIHLDSHEPDLLPTENEWGTHYWEQDWRAGSDATARATAWRQLADRFGAERAAWIARVLQPTNARPTTATAPNQPLNPAPIFPAVTVATDGKDSAWRHAPQARLMPDRWIAVLKFGATSIQVVGRDIARPLYVGPDPNPQPPPPPVPDDQLQLDPGMKWMVDFDEAEAKGMGLRITVPAAALSAGLDSLFVFGVAGKLGSDAAKQFANLLDAHHYTDGLEFLGFGTPTNNTDERRAAATHDDPEHERSYAIEVASDPMALDPQSNAVRVGTALGLPATAIVPVFGRVGQAAERHGLDMRSMNAALWQVGWGYYLSNMVGFDGTGLTPTILAWARDHFVNNVRSGGPYPALRCGHQPYGVLPVTSLDQWKPPTGQEQAMAPDSWLRDLLMKLRNNIWRPRVGDAFRLGRRSPSAPDADLADIMRMDGLASGYSARTMLGRHYLQHLRAFLGEDLAGNGFIATHDALAAGILQRLGIAWRPRLARTVGADTAWAVSAPLVQDGEVSPWRGLEPNYIAALLAQPSIAALTQARPDPASTTTTSLLQLLLRHALLRELADAAALVAGSVPGGDPTPFLRDAELIDLVTDPPQPAPSPPWTRRLDQPAPGIAGSPTMRQYLEGLTTFDTPATASLGDFRRSLIHLKNRDSETLQYLMQGTLDLSSHRLDAWITSFATKRLATMMAGAPQGAYVGAYGWVEKLRPTPASSVTAVTTLPAGEASPLVTRNNDSGFIHAPSMTHAAAAALLRNAHLGPTGTPAPDSPFAIDLSSRRAREAKRLLDGLRQGQPLGALLGFSLERALHDIELDIAIAGLRKLSPLAARPLDDGGGATEAIAANNVVDGLDLARKWQSNQQTVLDAAHPANTPPFTQDQINGLTRELNALADAIDGLSDALTAEAAYQVARGNTSRVASTLAAIAQGDAPPPELEVIRTPRTGTPLTHRLIVLFSGNPVVNPGWLATNSSPRASAEPMLNAWASKLIGNGTKIRCTIERLDDTTGAVVETRTLPLSEVAVGALDMVYGVEAITSGTQPDGSLSEVEQQILYYAKHKTGGFDPQATIRLQHARPTNLAAGETTLFDALEQARSVRRLLSAVRGAEPEDLNPPERTGAGTIDLVDLEARVVRAENALNAANSALKALVAPTATTTTAEALRTGLMKMGAFGIGPYVPVVAAGESPAAIATLGLQAKALLKTSGARLEQVAALRLVTAATDPRARRDQLVARMRNVFGQAFVVLPRFACDATGAAELTAALAASKQTQGGDPLAAHGWFAQYSRVRDTMGRMSACLRGAEVLATGERLNLSVAQLPLVAGERWVGLPPVPDTALPPGKLSLVLQTLATINTAQPLTGLLVDEWTETVPSTRETTAITFQFDPPDACPPQCVLVAVPPVPGVDWTSDALRQVLEETLDLAKLRAVDAETLGEVAHYMPALYLAFNAKDDAVSTDFAALTH